MNTNDELLAALDKLPPRPPLNTGATIGVSSLAYVTHHERGIDAEFDSLFFLVSDITESWDADLHEMLRRVYSSEDRVWMMMRSFPMDRLNRLALNSEINSTAQNGLRLFRMRCPELEKLNDAAAITLYTAFTEQFYGAPQWPPFRNSHFLLSLIGKLAKKDAAFSGEARSIGEHIAYWLLQGERPMDAFRQGLSGHNYDNALKGLVDMVVERAANITEAGPGPR